MTARQLSLDLDLPPSINAAFANVPGRGRVRTSIYRQWQQAALAAIAVQARGMTFAGRFRVMLLASDRELTRRRDVDNLGKALCDVLTKSGVIADDCYLHLRSIMLAWTPDLPAGSCRVAITELSAEPLPKPAKAPRQAVNVGFRRNTRAGAKVPASILAALRARGINVDASRVHL
jgi:Holliday junction resolvase RusA-like endonuclease